MTERTGPIRSGDSVAPALRGFLLYTVMSFPVLIGVGISNSVGDRWSFQRVSVYVVSVFATILFGIWGSLRARKENAGISVRLLALLGSWGLFGGLLLILT